MEYHQVDAGLFRGKTCPCGTDEWRSFGYKRHDPETHVGYVDARELRLENGNLPGDYIYEMLCVSCKKSLFRMKTRLSGKTLTSISY